MAFRRVSVGRDLLVGLDVPTEWVPALRQDTLRP